MQLVACFRLSLVLLWRAYVPGSTLTRKGRRAILCGIFSITNPRLVEATVNSAPLVLALLDEAYEKKTWHGPNLKQSIKGVSAKQAAWRPGPGRHNIWEVSLHAAYWKYAVRRRIEGGKRGRDAPRSRFEGSAARVLPYRSCPAGAA